MSSHNNIVSSTRNHNSSSPTDPAYPQAPNNFNAFDYAANAGDSPEGAGDSFDNPYSNSWAGIKNKYTGESKPSASSKFENFQHFNRYFKQDASTPTKFALNSAKSAKSGRTSNASHSVVLGGNQKRHLSYYSPQVVPGHSPPLSIPSHSPLAYTEGHVRPLPESPKSAGNRSPGSASDISVPAAASPVSPLSNSTRARRAVPKLSASLKAKES